MNDQTTLVTGTDFVMLPVASVEAAEEFYSGTLGLPCSSRWGKDFGAEFETGSLTIAVAALANIGREAKPGTGAVALHVDDVEAARAELESRGVEFSGETIDSGVCHQAFFQDPDGNALILHHRYAPRP